MKPRTVPPPKLNQYRPDIDSLRAIAICAVCGFHYAPSYFKGGFVGVDVFFVLSGYLITETLLNRSRESSARAYFGAFYAGRIIRLFPALIITLLLTIILGFLLLLPTELLELSRNMIAATTFTTNFLLIKSPGLEYFANSKDFNPLIHLWSLSIEEQFYLIWPILIYLTSSKVRTGQYALIIFTILWIIDIANFFSQYFDKYYFPGTRFWELILGSLYAIYKDKFEFYIANKNFFIKYHLFDYLKIFGVVLIVFSVFRVAPSPRWPGLLAILPCFGALCVLITPPPRQKSFLELLLCNRALLGLGRISYPLYLYHWLLLSFLYIVFIRTPPAFLVWCSFILSVAGAVFTYHFVEIPIRAAKRPVTVLALLLIMLAILASSFTIYSTQGLHWRFASEQKFNDLSALRPKFFMTDESCLKHYSKGFIDGFLPNRDFCRSTAQETSAKVLLVGDSHASQLYQAFEDLGFTSVAHIGRGSCPPLIGLEPTAGWLKCYPTVNGLINYAVHSSADLLILSGVFQRYFDGTYIVSQDSDAIQNQISILFDVLARSNKKVLMVLDNAVVPFDPKQCMRRPLNLNQRVDCSFSRANHDKFSQTYRESFLANVVDKPNISLLDASALFCDNSKCYVSNAEGLTYNTDDNHLSSRGAKLVVSEIIKRFPDFFHLRKEHPKNYP